MKDLRRNKNRFGIDSDELREQFGADDPPARLLAALGYGWRIYGRERDGRVWFACEIAPRLARVCLR